MRRHGAAGIASMAVVLAIVGSCSSAPSPMPSPSAELPASSTDAAPTTPGIASPSPASTMPADLAQRPFTVLVLGKDLEARTDVIMVVGIDPLSKVLSMASIPRDTINVPLPNGQVFSDRKINSFYNYAGTLPASYPQGPGQATVDMVGGMLGITIDYYAATTFGGFSALVDAMGGVTITLPKAVVDPFYQVTTTNVGISFPKGTQTLHGDRALIFARTRQGDNDFERQRRQQAFLIAAAQQLLAHPVLFGALLAVQGNLQTNVPLLEVPGLIDAIRSIDGWTINRAVLGPDKYESAAPCTCGYALAPKLDQFRHLAALYFPWAVRH